MELLARLQAALQRDAEIHQHVIAWVKEKAARIAELTAQIEQLAKDNTGINPTEIATVIDQLSAHAAELEAIVGTPAPAPTTETAPSASSTQQPATPEAASTTASTADATAAPAEGAAPAQAPTA